MCIPDKHSSRRITTAGSFRCLKRWKKKSEASQRVGYVEEPGQPLSSPQIMNSKSKEKRLVVSREALEEAEALSVLKLLPSSPGTKQELDFVRY